MSGSVSTFPCCNDLYTTFHNRNSNSCLFRRCDMSFPSWLGFRLRFSFCLCHAFHIMSSCASHLHSCLSHASEHFPRCSFCNPTLLCHPTSPFVSFLVRVLNILGMDQDLPSGLGTPPVDRLSSFVPFGVRLGTPSVNRGTIKASCVLQPNTPPKWPNNPSNPPPSSRPFDQDRMAENRTPFGLS